MQDLLKSWPRTISAWLLAGIVPGVAFLSLASRKGEATGGGAAGDTIPAQLRIHYDATDRSSYVGLSDEGETSTRWILDMTAVVELPNIDYRARTVQGNKVAYSIVYNGSELTGPPPSQLISFSGRASYSYESHSVWNSGGGTLKQNSNHQGVGPMGPGNGRFGIFINGDSILVEAGAEFPVTGEASWSSSGHASRQGSSPFRQEKYAVNTPRFPWSEAPTDPNWTVHIEWTGGGWAGTAEYHTHGNSGGLGQKKESEHVAKMTFTVDLSGKELVEAVMWADGYDGWEPTANLSGPGGLENESGEEQITVHVKLQVKDKPDAPVNQRATFRFELVKVSSEPGIALNWPPKDNVKGTPDLAIEQKGNVRLRLTGQTWQTQDGPAADKAETKEKNTEAQAVISSFDFGAWGTLEVSADTEDGQHLVAHLKGDRFVEALNLPKDSDGNHIADVWKMENGVIGAQPDTDALATMPTGNGFPGDGISLYERYRGFLYWDYAQQKPIHVRLDPQQKALFVYPQDAAGMQAGIEFFAQASGLDVYTITQYQMDDTRVINFNKKTANAVDQHALRLVWAILDEKLSGQSPIGPPWGVDNVQIKWTSVTPDVIAHELGHAVGMPHHGSGNYWRPDPIDATKDVYVAVQHGQNSGVQEGIMRYRWADYLKHQVGGKWQLDDYGGYDGPRTMFAEQDKGTGVNAPDQPWPKLPKAGDATPECGNSMRYLVVSDRYNVDLSALFKKKGC
jgi:hypothetical protein